MAAAARLISSSWADESVDLVSGVRRARNRSPHISPLSAAAGSPAAAISLVLFPRIAMLPVIPRAASPTGRITLAPRLLRKRDQPVGLTRLSPYSPGIVRGVALDSALPSQNRCHEEHGLVFQDQDNHEIRNPETAIDGPGHPLHRRTDRTRAPGSGRGLRPAILRQREIGRASCRERV